LSAATATNRDFVVTDPLHHVLTRSFGFSWSVSGWLLTPFMQKVGPEVVVKMRARVVAELKTTFASHYSHRVSLEEMVTPDAVAGWYARRTGQKYLVVPG
jgi:hypothetical protein